jgi:radical SAM superfamily enzyme YgiQ (UPF0313 family)
MKLLLLSPPFADPTLPRVGPAYLAAAVRADGGHHVEQVDLNLEVLEQVLSSTVLQAALEEAAERQGREPVPDSRRHAFSMLPQLVPRALAELRSQEAFFSAPRYRQASNAIELAVHLLNLAMSPWQIEEELTGMVRSTGPARTLADYQEELDDFARSRFNPVRDALDELTDEHIDRCRPDVVGISMVLDGQAMVGRYLAHRLKRRCPELVVILGGTSMVEQVNRLRCSPEAAMPVLFGSADYLVLGEGEPALVPLLDAIAAGRDVEEVPNLGYIDPDSGGFRQTRRVRVEDLDTLAPPEYEPEHLARCWSPLPVTLVSATRGCYWDRCTFCANGLREDGRATAAYREMSAPALIRHLQAVIGATGSRHIFFSVDVIAPGTAEKYARSFADNDLSFSWQSDIRPEGGWLRPGRIETLAAGGLSHVSMGIESCCQETLDTMSKGTSVSRFGPLFAAFSRAGIAVDLALFRGFPGETEEQLVAGLQLLKQNLEHIHRTLRLGKFYLIDGCQVRREPDRFGIVVHPVEGEPALRPDFREWSYADPAAQPRLDTEKVRQALQELCGETHVGRRPWVGSLGSSHTFLYFSCAGLDSVRQYNDFIGRVRRFLIQQVSFAAT